MLVLSRKKGEAIIIDGGIEIRIMDIQGDKVRLSIDAPKETNIYREEVYEVIKGSNTEATHADKNDLAVLKGFMEKNNPKK